MKTKEELNTLKEEVETLKKKLSELNEDELKMVVGGQEPQEFDWSGPGYSTPLKPEITGGHIFEAIGPIDGIPLDSDSRIKS